MENTEKREKIALCLGGGGTRGFAHIGALRAFEEAGLSFDIVAGTSVGALAGALYALGVKSADMERYGANLEMSAVHNGIWLTPNDPMKIGRIATDLAGNANIANAPIKFAAVAVDLTEAEQVVLDSGDVGAVVAASCAVPLLYRPVVYGDRHLVDGGLLNNIPADVCRMLGATRVVTVDVNPTRGGGTKELGMLDILKATFHIMTSNASTEGLRLSDVIVAPDTSEFTSVSKTGWEKMIERGYEAAKAALPRIRKLMDA